MVVFFIKLHVFTCIHGHPSAADEAWYWLKHFLRSGRLYVTSRPYFFKEMCFVGYSYVVSLLTMYIQMSQVYNIMLYHMSNSRECVGVNVEALQVHAVYIIHYKSCENSYQYYKSQESVLGTTSHVRYV